MDSQLDFADVSRLADLIEAGQLQAVLDGVHDEDIFVTEEIERAAWAEIVRRREECISELETQLTLARGGDRR